MISAFCPMHPEKKRMGSNFVYIHPSPHISKNYHDGLEYCLDTHGAQLPIIHRKEDLLGMLIGERITNCEQKFWYNLNYVWWSWRKLTHHVDVNPMDRVCKTGNQIRATSHGRLSYILLSGAGQPCSDQFTHGNGKTPLLMVGLE